MKNKFKPDLVVLNRFADVFWENKMIKKTNLHFLSRINWNSFNRYLEWLRINHYIKCMINGKDEFYQLTERGRCMFDMVMKLRDHIMSSNMTIP